GSSGERRLEQQFLAGIRRKAVVIGAVAGREGSTIPDAVVADEGVHRRSADRADHHVGNAGGIGRRSGAAGHEAALVVEVNEVALTEAEVRGSEGGDGAAIGAVLAAHGDVEGLRGYVDLHAAAGLRNKVLEVDLRER